MNYKNKLMGLSLIIVAMFSACSDEVENAGVTRARATTASPLP